MKEKKTHRIGKKFLLIMIPVLLAGMILWNDSDVSHAECSSNKVTCEKATNTYKTVSGTYGGKAYNRTQTIVGCTKCGGSGSRTLYYNGQDLVGAYGTIEYGKGYYYGDHSWSKKKTISSATCTTKGEWRYVCSYCSQVGATAHYTDALGHNYSGATCTKKGTCTRCGATSSALGHSYTGTTELRSDGYYYTKCIRCDTWKKGSAASFTNTIAHWMWGLDGTGTNSTQDAYKIGTTTFTGTYNTSIAIDQSKAVKVPKGAYMYETFGTGGLGSSWGHYAYGKYTQPAKGIGIEYHYMPYEYTITYELDGGTQQALNPTTYTVLNGKSYVPLDNKEGYEFVGWTEKTKVTTLNMSAVALEEKGGIDNDTGEYSAVWNGYAATPDLIPVQGGITLQSNYEICAVYSYDADGNFIKRESSYTKIHPISKNAAYIRIEVNTTKGTSFATYRDYLTLENLEADNGEFDYSNHNYNWNALKSNLVPGTTYTVTMDEAKLESGSATEISVAIYDFTDSKALVFKNIGFGKNIEFDMKCPADADKTHDIRLLIYGGGSGYVKGNQVTFKNIQISNLSEGINKGDTDSFSSADDLYAQLDTRNTGDITLVATWKENSYQIIFDNDGGTGGPGSMTVLHGVSATIPNDAPTKTGYTFKGWKDVDANKVYQPGDSITVTSALTLVAQWTANKYTVTYDANGGTLDGASSVTAYYDTDVDLSKTATKDGRIFLGWAESKLDTICLTNKKMPAKDITLYAVYSFNVSDVKESFLVSWDSKGNQNVVEMNLEGTNPNGYLYTKSNVNLLTGLTYQSTDEVSVAIVIYDNAGNKTIIPVVKGTAAAPEPEMPDKYMQTTKHWTWNLETEKWVYLTSTEELVEENQVYTPKYLDSSDSAYPKGYYNYKIDKAYTVTKVAEANAYYKPISYKLIFDPNGGSCDVKEKTVYNDYVIGELPTAKRDGYDFLGWYTDKKGGTEIKDSDKFTGTKDQTVYAHWEKRSYKVTYDYATNLGQNADFTEATVGYGDKVDLSNKAYKPGWKFIGWNTDADETIGLGYTTMPDHDLYLYAIYEKEITATFIDYDDNKQMTRTKSETMYNRDTSVDITCYNQYKKSGWEKLGWAKDTTGNATILCASNAKLNLTEDITLYGCYTRQITLAYDLNGSDYVIDPETKDQYFNSFGTYKNPQFTVAQKPDREDYSFVTWEIAEGKDVGKSYDAGQTITLDQNTLLKAKWDKFPEIEAYDRYFTLEEAQNGSITQERLFEKVRATDLEDGNLENGTSVTIPAYQAEDFTSFTDDGSVTVTYEAKDSFGNTVKKTVTIYIVETDNTDALTKSYVRFIDAEFFKAEDGSFVDKADGGLEISSTWKTEEEYTAALENVLSAKKENQTSNTMTVLGKEREVPDLSSGTWTLRKEQWVFNRTNMDDIRTFVDTYGYGKYKNTDAINKFYEEFGKYCN